MRGTLPRARFRSPSVKYNSVEAPRAPEYGAHSGGGSHATGNSYATRGALRVAAQPSMALRGHLRSRRAARARPRPLPGARARPRLGRGGSEPSRGARLARAPDAERQLPAARDRAQSGLDPRRDGALVRRAFGRAVEPRPA